MGIQVIARMDPHRPTGVQGRTRSNTSLTIFHLRSGAGKRTSTLYHTAGLSIPAAAHGPFWYTKGTNDGDRSVTLWADCTSWTTP